MSVSAFLKVDGIDGESTDSEHSKWIELHSFSMGCSQSESGSSISQGGALASGRSFMNSFTVAKNIDKASPKLWEACLLGKHIDTVTLSVARQTGGSSGAVEFIKYEIKQTLVTSVSQGGSDGDSLPYENVSFVGVKHTVTYTETDTKGSKKGQVEATYDLSKNK